MYKKIKKQQIGLAIILFLFACSPTHTPSITETIELTATNSPAVSETVTFTTTPLPTVDVNTIESLVLDPDYLKGCHELNPTPYKEQASYKGIFPGKTTSIEVKQLIGEPIKIYEKDAWWVYDDYAVVFDGEIVSEMRVPVVPSLYEMIKKYGCPEAIFAFHLTEDNPAADEPGTLGMVRFVYPAIGLEFEIYNYPAQLSDENYVVYYYVPKSLHDYIYDKTFRKELLETPGIIKLVTWDEAVEE